MLILTTSGPKRRARGRGIRAWLATWEWSSESAEVVDRIATVLPSRWSEARVKDVIDHLYAFHSHNAVDMTALAKNGGIMPLSTRHKYSDDSNLYCGSHPELRIRKVSRLRVETLVSGYERVSWTEPDRYRFDEETGAIELTHKGRTRSTTRIVRGPLRWDLVWDRAGACRRPEFAIVERVEEP